MLDEGKIMFVDPTVCDGKFFMWHYHHGGGEMRFGEMECPKYAFNKEITTEEF